MKVFIAGPRVISKLNRLVTRRMQNLINDNFKILVGDANGIDKAVQTFFYNNQYGNVEVYASNGKIRNNVGNWLVKSVEVPSGVKGFDFYAAKDLEMAKQADYGFMIWNGKSRGTFNNIKNLVEQNKEVLIYFTPHQKFYKVNSPEAIHQLLRIRDQKPTNISIANSPESEDNNIKQISLFK